MMKRCFYIANNYDGAYFVLTDDIHQFGMRLSAYLLNLQKSQKCNHYRFGSVEMTESDYEKHATEARELEQTLVKKPEVKPEPKPARPTLHLVE
jgi:hypothetical protein